MEETAPTEPVPAPAAGQASRKFTPCPQGAPGQMCCSAAGALTHLAPPARQNHGASGCPGQAPSAQLGNIKNLASLAACIRSSGPFPCCCCQMLMGVWEAGRNVSVQGQVETGLQGGVGLRGEPARHHVHLQLWAPGGQLQALGAWIDFSIEEGIMVGPTSQAHGRTE